MSKSFVDPVFVITRNGRRVEPENYLNKYDASKRFDALVATIKNWDPNSQNVLKIVKTTSPHKYR